MLRKICSDTSSLTYKIHDYFGMEICVALTAFHAFSGSLNRKCKVGTLILLEKNESTQRKFSKLNAITEDDIQAVEGLV